MDGRERARPERGGGVGDALHDIGRVERADGLAHGGEVAQARGAGDGLGVLRGVLHRHRSLRGERGEERLVLRRPRAAGRRVHREDAERRLAGDDRHREQRREPGRDGPLTCGDARVLAHVGDEERRARHRRAPGRVLAEGERLGHPREIGGARLDARGPAPEALARRVRDPHLHHGDLEQPRRGLRDPPQHVVEVERARDELLERGQLAQPVGAARRVGVERGVVDRERRLLGEELERLDLLGAERALAPVVDDERAVDAALGHERRGGHGLVALARDRRAALGREPQGRVGQDVPRRDRAPLEHRAADRSAADRHRLERPVLEPEPAGRAQDAELGRDAVPGDDQRGVGAHDLERLAGDRVEHLVEVERGAEGLADRLDRVQEQGAAVPLGDVGEDEDRARGAVVGPAPRHAARLEPGEAVTGRGRVGDLEGAGRLAAQGAVEARGQLGIPEEGQDGVHRPAEGAGAGHAGEPLHRPVPLDDGPCRVHRDQRGVERVEEARRRIPHRASILRVAGPVQ